MHKKPLLAAVVLSVPTLLIAVALIYGTYRLGAPPAVASLVSIIFCLSVGLIVPRYMKWWNKLWESK